MKHVALILNLLLFHNAVFSEAGELRKPTAYKRELMPKEEEAKESFYGGGGQCPLYALDTTYNSLYYEPKSQPAYPMYAEDGKKKIIIKVPDTTMSTGDIANCAIGDKLVGNAKAKSRRCGPYGCNDFKVGISDFAAVVTSDEYPGSGQCTVLTSGTIRFDNRYWCYGSITYSCAMAFPPDITKGTPYSPYQRSYGSGYYYYDTAPVCAITGGTGDFAAANGSIRFEYYKNYALLCIFPYEDKAEW